MNKSKAYIAVAANMLISLLLNLRVFASDGQNPSTGERTFIFIAAAVGGGAVIMLLLFTLLSKGKKGRKRRDGR